MARSIGWHSPLAATLALLVLVPTTRAADLDAVAALRKLGGLSARAGSDSEAPVVKVEFNRAALTDAKLQEAVPHLKKLRALRALTLGFTAVTDAGLVHLKDLTDLEELGLAQTGVTNAGLAYLKGLKKLKRLDLVGTKVTEQAARELKSALPGVEISRARAAKLIGGRTDGTLLSVGITCALCYSSSPPSS